MQGTEEAASELVFNDPLTLLSWNLNQLKLRLDTLVEHLIPAVVNIEGEEQQNVVRLAYEVAFHYNLTEACRVAAEQQRRAQLLAP